MTDSDNPVLPKCPRCGATVASNAPEGLCPRCLIALNFVTETEIPGEESPLGTQVSKPPVPPVPCPEALAPHFPQLEILEVLGRGGMGAVYKARQPNLDRFVALKILLRRHEDGKGDVAFAQRFAREARALALLNHPNIVAVYDYGEVGGYPFLVMEYIEGLTLRQLLQHGKLAPEEALAIVPRICEALQFAHQKGIVHRDIKPENILLDKAGQVKITDFGIAKVVRPGASERSLTGVKDVVGTPHYMAPEQVEKPNTVDHRADIYSLGVVFYELLTGELPLGKFAPPSQKVQIDARLDTVVLRALEKEPVRRYQHASEVKTQLEAIAAGPAASDSFQNRKARRGVVFAITVGLVAASSLLWIWRSKTANSGGRNAQQHFEPGNLGWFLAGKNREQYETAADRDVTRNGKPATLLKSTVENPVGFATLMQTVKADVFRQQRVRMNGFLRLEGVSERAGLWMRVDGMLIEGSKNAEPLAFDNMEERPVRGTADWAPYSIVLDVPERAQEIAFGISLAGPGKLWLADLSFEVVGKDAATTGAKLTKEPLETPKLNFD